MNARSFFLSGALASLTSAACASGPQVLASASFDSGTEGWRAYNGAMNFQPEPSGGDPGGYIVAQDSQGGGLWFFAPPANSAFTGNLSQAFGGVLSFAERVISPNPPTAHAQVQLVNGSGNILSYYSASISPNLKWATYSVVLSPTTPAGTWTYFPSSNGPGTLATTSEMMSVLTNVTSLRILGDYRQAGEITSLDSVVLTAAPVPEPGTAAFMLTGVGLLALRSRRKRAKSC